MSPGPELEDLQEVPVNTIVLQSDDEGASLSDPLNVIPDEYEYDQYDQYDPDDIPPDQARPKELNSYVAAEQPSYVAEEQPSYSSTPLEDEESDNEVGDEEYIPFDANLRDVVEFSTIGPVPDIAITTYSPEIDFDLGTTSADGIEVVNVVTAIEEDPAEYLDDILAGSNDVESAQPLYDDEYENEEPTSYQPDNVDIPIVVEESQGVTVDLPSYDPVVLLVGTPVVQVGAFIKVSSNKFLVTICHRPAVFDRPPKRCVVVLTTAHPTQIFAPFPTAPLLLSQVSLTSRRCCTPNTQHSALYFSQLHFSLNSYSPCRAPSNQLASRPPTSLSSATRSWRRRRMPRGTPRRERTRRTRRGG